MHSDQLDIDDELARRLIAQQLPDLESYEVTRLPGVGTVNATFKVGGGLTARFPLQLSDPGDAHAALELEAAALAEFADMSPVPAPVPFAIVRPDGGHPMPWSLQTWVDGAVMTPVDVAASHEVASDLGGLIRALRAAPVYGRRFRGHGRGGTLSDHDAWMQHCLGQIEPYMDAEPLRSMWARFRQLPAGQPHVMAHSDLTPWNLLTADGQLAGVLDAGWFGPADPSLDLVCAWHLFDPPARAVLRTELAATDVEWERGAAWAFEQAMGLVWYYHTSNPAMAWLGETTITRLLQARGSEF